ncbi:MAG: hypothetical protein CMJ72_06430 [Planctomycetaceae bacterium]|nr:hypothetical protein [Planctomycetaceae bacterium]
MRLDVCIASALQEAHSAYQLVHNCYQAQVYAPSDNASGLYYQDRFCREDSRPLIASQGSIPPTLGTLTIVSNSDEGLGVDTSLRDEATQLRNQDALLGEVTALATSPQARDQSDPPHG